MPQLGGHLSFRPPAGHPRTKLILSHISIAGIPVSLISISCRAWAQEDEPDHGDSEDLANGNQRA